MTLQYNIPAVAPPSGGLGGLLSYIGDVQIGVDQSNNFALTASGLGVNRVDGVCVALDEAADSLLDVTALVLPGVNPFVIRVPVALNAVKRGDLVIVSDDPFSPLFVLGVENESRLLCLDPLAGEIITYTPAVNPFFNMLVLAVSILDAFTGDQNADPVDDGGRGGRDDFLPLMILAASGAGLGGAPASPPAAGAGSPASAAGASSLATLLPILLAMGFGDGFRGGAAGRSREDRGDGEERAGPALGGLLPWLLILGSGLTGFGAPPTASGQTGSGQTGAPTAVSPGGLPATLLALALAGGGLGGGLGAGFGGGLGGAFGDRRRGRREEGEGRGIGEGLALALLLGGLQGAPAASTASSGGAASGGALATGPGATLPVLLAGLALAGGGFGGGGLFGGRRGDPGADDGGRRADALLPMVALAAALSGGLPGGAAGGANGLTTPLLLGALFGGEAGGLFGGGRRPGRRGDEDLSRADGTP